LFVEGKMEFSPGPSYRHVEERQMQNRATIGADELRDLAARTNLLRDNAILKMQSHRPLIMGVE
jgi:hypothetical protein